MPPGGPLRTDDGPPCRVCGCTEHNACVIRSDETFTEGIAKAVCMPSVRMPRILTCSWVETNGADDPRWLCSACAGTEADLINVIERVDKILDRPAAGLALVAALTARAVVLAARNRIERRKRGDYAGS